MTDTKYHSTKRLFSDDSGDLDSELRSKSKVHVSRLMKVEESEMSSPPGSKRKSLDCRKSSSDQKRRCSITKMFKENSDPTKTPNRICGKIPSNVSPPLSKMSHDGDGATGTQNRTLAWSPVLRSVSLRSVSENSLDSFTLEDDHVTSNSHDENLLSMPLSSKLPQHPLHFPFLEEDALFLFNDTETTLTCVRIGVQLYHSFASKISHLMQTFKTHIKYRDVRVVLERFIRWERKKR